MSSPIKVMVGVILVIVAASQAYWLIGMIYAFGYPDWTRVALFMGVNLLCFVVGVISIVKGAKRARP
jgi:hypothetical protein